MRIEQNGPESAELSSDGSFVIVRVPVEISGDPPSGKMRLRYTLGAFMGREADIFVRSPQDKLTVRIPKEIFRSRDRLSIQVFVLGETGRENSLWNARYEAGWLGSVPRLEPVADLLAEPPTEER